MWESLAPPLWKACADVPFDEAERVSALFQLTPAPSPQSVIVLTAPGARHATVEAYYATEPDGAPLSDITGHTVRVEALGDTDWVRLSQEGLPPVRAGRFFVYGAHDRGKAPANTVPLAIDAVEAFGTGHHETTRACLIALDQLKRTGFAPCRVLDLGSGTGVLALASVRLWRCRAVATDIDPVAAGACRRNIRTNGSQALVQALVADGLNHASIHALRPFDLIIANILAGPLTFLAPQINAALAPGARVILSGLLNVQENLVLSFYTSLGLRLEQRLRLGPWSALVLRNMRSA